MTVKILKKYRIVPVFTLGEDWGYLADVWMAVDG